MSKKIVGINLIPKWKDWHNKYCYIAEVEEIEDKPKETLEEKIKVYLGTPSPVCPDGKVSEHISKIAKDYFKEHPEEIDCVHIKCADESLSHVKGMVSLDKVLAVFDMADKEADRDLDKAFNRISFIRKALEGMGGDKKINREGDNVVSEIEKNTEGGIYECSIGDKRFIEKTHYDLARMIYRILRRAIRFHDFDQGDLLVLLNKMEGKSSEEIKELIGKELWEVKQ